MKPPAEDLLTSLETWTAPTPLTPPLLKTDIETMIRYYETAGPDYAAWSRNFNMHFGFWRPGMYPWRRECMLEETSRQVLLRLDVKGEGHGTHVLDLGCGLGASMETAARFFPGLRITGVTVVPGQARAGKARIMRSGNAGRLRIIQANFEGLPLPEGSVDGCYAIEAATHASGEDKARLIREVFRVLRPGGRLVVFDCFLKKRPEGMHPLIRKCYRKVCRGWTVKEMPLLSSFSGALSESGFSCIGLEDISWSVAPSVAHAPFVSVRFLLGKLLRRETMTTETVQHVTSCLLACILGLDRSSFGYYLITAEKPSLESSTKEAGGSRYLTPNVRL